MNGHINRKEIIFHSLNIHIEFELLFVSYRSAFEQTKCQQEIDINSIERMFLFVSSSFRLSSDIETKTKQKRMTINLIDP